ncbi:hypothetical protein ABBQ38_003127 [Trebouxia sp. C0009 RCD-2024]
MTDTSSSPSVASAAQNGTEATPSNDAIAQAEQFKVVANEAFKEKNYMTAIEQYGKAIDSNPLSAVYHANRAFAHIRMETYGSAVEDAAQAIALDPKYVKGYYRRGDAHFALGKFKIALKDFKSAARLAPRDPDLRKKLTACEKEVKRMRFEEALATPDVPQTPPAETIDLASMTVEDSYDGPHLQGNLEEGYTVTPAFMQDMLQRFKDQKLIHRRYAFAIILQAYHILRKLPSLVDVPVPKGSKLTVCGDVHGQYFDLLNIFDINGLPSEDNPYLFNGDFVDRGSWSAEIILTLFAYKVLYPEHVHLARGNHESRGMNKIYGFDGEISHKFSSQMIELFRDTFCWLPLAHVLDSRVFVVHGGLFSKDGVKLSDIRSIDRHREPPEDGLMCEMLWSDPKPSEGRGPSQRGVGVGFGPDVTRNFLEDNQLDLLVRSHEVKDDGYEIAHDGNCITVFSAPNYCDQMGNKGAFITFTGGDMSPQFTQFSAVPHPDVKPMAYASSMMGNMWGF